MLAADAEPAGSIAATTAKSKPRCAAAHDPTPSHDKLQTVPRAPWEVKGGGRLNVG